MGTSVNHFGNSAEPEVKIENDGNENTDTDSLDEETVSDQETANKEFEDTEEREELDENMSIVQQNKRIARSPNDPFDQQQEDVSAFVLKTKPCKQHGQAILSFQNPRDNEISNTPLRSTRERIPYYPPGSLHDDTLVNDLLLS